jgi:hypothetical protein
MKKILLLFVTLFWIGIAANAQVLFSDDFESGITNWTTTGTWGLSTTQAVSPTHSLSESPTGNYAANLETYCTMNTGVDLSTYPSASLTFQGRYKIEDSFDYMYVEISTDNFVTHIDAATYTGDQSTAFSLYTIDLGGYCGNNNVKVRFHFSSDQGLQYDGMYIDDFTITASTIDNSPPLILHNPLPFYEGALNEMVINASLIDFSGINVTNSVLYYSVDGGADQTVPAVLVSGNDYHFTIPTQTPGAYVSYLIHAEDNYSTPNAIESPVYTYIAGNHIIQDNGQVDFYSAIDPASATAPSNGVCVKVALGNTDLVGILIRNYTDTDNPNDQMLVHVWNEVAGLPGTDVITPFLVTPAATLSNTSAMTCIDLRSYAAQLTGLTGNYYIGFTVPSGIVNVTMTEPGSFNRSYVLVGTTWSISQGTSGVADYHFRAITSLNQDIEGPSIVNNTPPVLHEANLSTQTISATVNDMTGVASTDVHYKVDNGTEQVVAGTLVSGSNYSYVIPAQPAGAWIKYWISATDVVTPTPYTNETDTFIYVSGVYHKFDDGNPDVYIGVGSLATFNYIAEMVNFGAQYADLTSLLIRNYYSTATPANTPNNPMTIHVWGDNAGLPGTDLITPFVVPSEASATNPMAITKVDLRPYSAQLSGKTGMIYAGVVMPTGDCAILATETGTFAHTFISDGTVWVASTSDAEMRLVTTALITNVSSNMIDNIIDVYPNPTSDLVNIFIDKTENTQLQIININGQVVLEKQINEQNTLLDVSAYNKGVYIVRISNQTGVSINKLVVK